ncbi:MAG TPA: tetraacyldisaccharide 4'-kinase [Stellaceae bacterium]
MRAPEFWHEPPGLIAGLLAPFGMAFDAASRLRRAIVRPYRAPVPVICVGNLVAGGSGKTPIVMSLAGALAVRGVVVHVVSRGYGGRLSGPIQVDPAVHDAAQVGDEPLLIAAHAPCWVSRDRAAGVRTAVEAGAEAILLDDGFQNPSVAKDLTFIAVDSGYGFGNGQVIPAGPLREQVSAGLTRANAIVAIGGQEEAHGLAGAPCPILNAELRAVAGERFAGERIVAFAGIGRPEKFFASLRELGAKVAGEQQFPDHHPFRESDLVRLRDMADREHARLVTTAKDWVRLPPSLRGGIEVLEVEVRWRDPSALERLLWDCLARRHDGSDLSAARG